MEVKYKAKVKNTYMIHKTKHVLWHKVNSFSPLPVVSLESDDLFDAVDPVMSRNGPLHQALHLHCKQTKRLFSTPYVHSTFQG